MRQALLFDMDGVLLDTERIHHEARMAVYRKYGMDYERIRHIPVAGRNTDAIFRDVHILSPFPAPLPVVIAEKRDRFVALLGSSIEPLPGVRYLLNRYRGRLKIALISASARQNVQAALKNAGLWNYFKVRITAEDVETHKPDPSAYLLGLSRLNIPPGGAIVFEDSRVGIMAGRAAGTRVVGVRTGYPEEDLSGADLTVADLESGRDEVVRFIEE